MNPDNARSNDPRLPILDRRGIRGSDAVSQLHYIDTELGNRGMTISDLEQAATAETTESRVANLVAVVGNDSVRAALVLLLEEKRRQEHDDPS